ncbi:MAG: DEAD/DEAH box helicase, partial [Clostridia bacterium]|nr:DEAD/DEAH box helicase [Clostridia bacterium]
MDKFTVLQEYFGHEEFRRGQGEIIDALTGGRDVLAIMPTGGGKSICYQIPALMADGVTFVISPLISLMKDQVQALIQNGIRAAYINSSLTANQYYKVLDNMRAGVYKIIYIAPERLESDGFLQCCWEMNISLIAIDEAHCVSGWGQDFRPAYLGISRFINSLP